MRKLLILTLLNTLAATATGAQAKGLKWMAGPPGLPAGSTFAGVWGDPGKAGMFTIQARLPANYVVPPHHHPTDKKIGVVSAAPSATAWATKSTAPRPLRSTRAIT